MYLDRPHIRYDGIYVSRNTYIKVSLLQTEAVCQPQCAAHQVFCHDWILLS